MVLEGSAGVLSSCSDVRLEGLEASDRWARERSEASCWYGRKWSRMEEPDSAYSPGDLAKEKAWVRIDFEQSGFVYLPCVAKDSISAQYCLLADLRVAERGGDLQAFRADRAKTKERKEKAKSKKAQWKDSYWDGYSSWTRHS